MDFAPLVEKKISRFDELERMVADPQLFDDPKRAREVLREHVRTKDLLGLWKDLEQVERQIQDNQELSDSDSDPELAAMAAEELPLLQTRKEKLDFQVQLALLPPDPNEERDAIVEIRAGTGGDEASLFAADLFKMYTRYAEAQGLRYEMLESSESPGVGGFKEVIFRVSGEAVFRKFKFESGVHRVQRVPATEAQGRIHTSTATVAVLPEAEEVDLELKHDEIRIEVCRAGGPGGQGVNTTDSAVQVMHIPTGMIVRCQDGRSQIKNKEKALSILRSRLLEIKQREEAEKYAAQRKNQVGTGGREEKIRTYNFPQNRVTDHRINVTLHSLDAFMEGDISDMVDSLQVQELQERMAELTA
ncbi:MAG: peptide chain release factor 1 [Verrucomicrobiales bacterium]